MKNEIKKIRNDLYNQQQLNEIKETLDESQKRQNEIIREPGCSAWLVTLPIGYYIYIYNYNQGLTNIFQSLNVHVRGRN